MIRIIILAAILATAANARLRVLQPRADTDYRLPTTTIPESYDILLNTYLDPDFTYDGEISIKITAKAITNDIVMHSTTGVVIDESSVTINGVKHNGITYDVEKNFVTIKVTDALVIEETYVVFIKFRGVIRDDTSGFYRSSYVNKNKETIWLATTQFQPTHARLVFPCYDEPGLKATFTIKITHAPKYSAISNMPVATLATVNGRSVTTFQESLKMSTYLVAFVVSDYISIQDFDDTFKVYTYAEAKDSAKYALDYGQKALKFLEKFTKHSYQLPKLDMISIADFTMGAMENWGLVTYREPYLLYTEGVSTSRNKQNIANMVAHELSHMWFGNQVTPEWWDCSWLNEGFATYLEYYTTSHIERNWRMMDQYVVNVVQNVMESDSTVNTRPMTSPLKTPEEIANSFNYVIYSKAGAVLRMMQHFLTMSTFQNGLTLYLNQRKYTTTNPDYLYNALQTEEDKVGVLPKSVTIKEIMDSWTTQKGFPVITVTRNYTNGVTQLEQERFLLHSKTDPDSVKYWVPINYGHISDDFEDTSVADWIPPTIKSIVITFNYPDNWLIVNKQQTGYYRVNYDKTNWNLLSKTLNSDDFYKIHILNRAQLVDDALNLARAGRLEYDIAFDITNYLQRETDYIPWSAANNELNYLNRLLAGSMEYNHFRRYIWDTVTNVYNSFSFVEHSADSHVVKLNRPVIQNWACGTSMDECIDNAMELLNSWRYADDTSENPIPPNQRSTIYCNGVRYSNGDEWDFLWDQFEIAETEVEKDTIINNLGCAQNDHLIEKYLQLSISDNEHLRIGDHNLIFSSVYSSGLKGVNKTLEFLENNFIDMKNKYNRFGEAISGLANYLITKDHKTQLQKIITSHESDFTEIQSLNAVLALSTVDTNLKWLDLYGASISKWLLEHIPEPAPERASAAGILINFSLLFTSVVFIYLVNH